MPADANSKPVLDVSAAALLGVVAQEHILPLISVVRAANDEGFDTDLRTIALAWQLGRLVEPERSHAEAGPD